MAPKGAFLLYINATMYSVIASIAKQSPPTIRHCERSEAISLNGSGFTPGTKEITTSQAPRNDRLETFF
jgi:hypothetical protein